MTARANERIAYFNGSYVPESEVRVPFRDRSWVFGDGAFDMTRTFNGRLFKIKEHVERLYRSLKVLRIDPGLSPAEMIGISEEVNGRNLHLLGPDEDQWVGQRISRGINRGRRRQLGPLRADRDRRDRCRCRSRRARAFIATASTWSCPRSAGSPPTR